MYGCYMRREDYAENDFHVAVMENNVGFEFL